MASHTICSLVLTAVLMVSQTLAYDTGAPDEACGTMVPNHLNDTTGAQLQPQQGNPWYMVQVNHPLLTIYPADTMQVTIRTVEPGKYVEGFLLAAVTPDGARHGTWMTTNSTIQRMACGGTAITHINRREDHNGGHAHWDTVTAHWTAPDYEVKNLVFKATVVKNYLTFFTNLHSSTFNDESNSARSVVAPCMTLVISTIIMTLLR